MMLLLCTAARDAMMQIVGGCSASLPGTDYRNCGRLLMRMSLCRESMLTLVRISLLKPGLLMNRLLGRAVPCLSPCLLTGHENKRVGRRCRSPDRSPARSARFYAVPIGVQDLARSLPG